MSVKERVAFGSLIASLLLALSKFAVGLATGSLGVLSEAAHSLVDFGATAMTLWAVRIGDRPADESHPYGHGKIESLAALGETALLFLAAAWIGSEAVKRLLFGGPAMEATGVAAAVLVVSVVVDYWRARALRRVATETGSHALAADALHFTSDMFSSGVVLIGLGFVALGFPSADAWAALAVAGFIFVAGWRLARRTVDVLIDTAPPGAAPAIAAAVGRLPGIVSVERVRARPLGSSLYVDVEVGVSRTLPLERLAALKETVAETIRNETPEAEIVVSTFPRALDDETAAQRVQVIAANEGLAVHHVVAQHLGGRRCIALDLEVDGQMDLARAHEVASRLESRIREAFGPETEVETHIEPLAADDLHGREVAPAKREAILAALTRHAEDGGLMRDVHDVRARETRDGVVVVFHARTDPARAVRDVHDAVDHIERRLRRDFPEIVRVVGHAEPERRDP